MAEEKKGKKAESAKITLERVYTVPLRREWLKVQRYKRTRKAMDGLRQFIERHMKSTDVKISRAVNMFMWNHGIKNPPSQITVKATKDEAGVVMVDFEKPTLAKIPAALKKSHSKAAASDKKKTAAKKDDTKVVEAKAVEKEEIKEMKADHHKETAPKAPKTATQSSAKTNASAPAHQ